MTCKMPGPFVDYFNLLKAQNKLADLFMSVWQAGMQCWFDTTARRPV